MQKLVEAIDITQLNTYSTVCKFRYIITAARTMQKIKKRETHRLKGNPKPPILHALVNFTIII